MYNRGDQVAPVVSVDGARTWSSWYNQSTAQIYRVATDSRFPFWVYGAQQDSGAIAVPSRSSGRGISMHDWHPIEAGGESDSVAPDPLHPGILFGSRIVRQDIDTRAVRDVSPTLARPGAWRATWTRRRLPMRRRARDAASCIRSRPRPCVRI